MPKKIGIAVDNYKLKKFRKALIHEGYKDFHESPYIMQTTIITLTIDESKISDIARICKQCEIELKMSN
jgi:hypothetical protein